MLFAATALAISIQIHRTFVDWTSPQGEIRSEVICQIDSKLEIQDRRNAEPGSLPAWTGYSCPSLYRKLPVEIEVRGRALIGQELGKEQMSSTFLLSVNPIETDFQFINEVQLTNSWEFRTEDLNLKSWMFRLRPTELISIICSDGNCRQEGPESSWKAEVRVYSAN